MPRTKGESTVYPGKTAEIRYKCHDCGASIPITNTAQPYGDSVKVESDMSADRSHATICARTRLAAMTDESLQRTEESLKRWMPGAVEGPLGEVLLKEWRRRTQATL